MLGTANHGVASRKAPVKVEGYDEVDASCAKDTKAIR